MFEEDLVTYLKGNSDVADGFTAAGGAMVRVSPDDISYEDDRPNVVYELIAEPPDYHMLGQEEIVQSTYRFRCQARKSIDAKAIAAGVHTALTGFKGTMGSTEVHGSFIGNTGDNYVPAKAGEEKGIYERIVDVDIHHEEEVPEYVT